MISIPKNIKEFQDNIIQNNYTIKDIVNLYLKNIENTKDLNIYLEVFDDIISMAEEKDKILKDLDKNSKIELYQKYPLFGVVSAIKDNILIENKICSSASLILNDYKATYDATVIKKLRDAGVLFIGRVNMDEFAMGGSTENSAYGVTYNPINKEYVSGGSSGGSAAAIASNTCLFSLGSDTGGSVRQPAAYCNTIGYKPTYGTVSRHGLMPMASSFDVIGIFSNDINDVKIIYNIIQGEDKFDSTSHNIKYTDILHDKDLILKKRIALPRSFIYTDGVSDEVKESIDKTILRFKEIGYEIVDIDIDLLKHSLALYYILVPAEVSSNMARYDGIRYGSKIESKTLFDDYANTRGQLFGNEVKRRILLGTYILSAGYHDAYYKKASILRNDLINRFKQIFNDFDAILLPTTPDHAFKVGEKTQDVLKLYLADIFTVTANLTGMPAISFPYKDYKNMPLGIQLIADTDKDNILFEIVKNIK